MIDVRTDVGPVAGALLAEAIEATVVAAGRCRLGLAGGSTPATVLRWLAAHLDPALSRALVVTWIDERHDPRGVPADWRELSPDSNLRGAWEDWFSRVDAVPALVPLDAAGSLDEARAAVAATWTAAVGALDVVLLGCGADGHVASLFPGHAALAARGPVVAVSDSPKPPPERLTLSLDVLRGAGHRVLVATGAAKASVLARAWRGDPTLPLTLTRTTSATCHWVVDPDAASLLGAHPA